MSRLPLFIVTLVSSIISASFGITKFLKFGPCRLVSSVYVSIGFIVLFLNVLSTIVSKGWMLAISQNVVGGFTANDDDDLIKYGMRIVIPMIFLLNLLYVSMKTQNKNIIKQDLFFQSAFVLFFTTSPMKKTLNTLLHYPPLILTPVFSIWTFGPPGPGFQCKRQNMMKISWFLTWGNLILNTLEIIILIGIAYQNRHSQFLDYGFLPFIFTWKTRLFLPLSFLSLTWITLIILQISFKNANHCSNWCQSNCCPDFDETTLDINKPFEETYSMPRHDLIEIQEHGV